MSHQLYEKVEKKMSCQHPFEKKLLLEHICHWEVSFAEVSDLGAAVIEEQVSESQVSSTHSLKKHFCAKKTLNVHSNTSFSSIVFIIFL
jgi:hypothetical protein